MTPHSLSDADLILRLVELSPRSIRAGAESVVVLYLWVRKRGSPAGFAAAVSDAVGQNYLEVRRDGGFFLRLTPAGFGYLQQSLASDAPVECEAPKLGGNADAADRLLDILITVNMGAARAVSPAAIKQIWSICRYRSSDLRRAIDALTDGGALAMTGMELPGVVLTRAGREMAGLSGTGR